MSVHQYKTELLVLRDYNAGIGKSFGQELEDFAAEHMFFINQMCNKDSFYTYLSASHNNISSWLGHVVCTVRHIIT